MNVPLSYQQFLEAKIAMAPKMGFDVADHEINPILLGHQRAIVKWACRGGRRAIFAAFGLGKTVMQLEILRLVTMRTGGRGLLVAPLGVRQEFRRDAEVVMWANEYGFIPGKKQIDHKCRQRRCVRPDHGELVTHRQNQKRRDAARRLEGRR